MLCDVYRDDLTKTISQKMRRVMKHRAMRHFNTFLRKKAFLSTITANH